MGNQTPGFVASVMISLSSWWPGPRGAGRRGVDRARTRKESGTPHLGVPDSRAGSAAGFRQGYRRSWQTKSSWVDRSWASSAGVTWVLIEKVSERLPSAVAAMSWV